MTARVAGGDGWQVEIAGGSREWRLSYTCPTCTVAQAIMLQPLPWRVPAEKVTEDRRRAGNVKHRDVHEVVTQVWCHRCATGADVTVSDS